MIPLCRNISHSPTFFCRPRPPCSRYFLSKRLRPTTIYRRKLRTEGICRAELSTDAPFAIAIGACMLNSLFFPDKSDLSEEEVERDAVVGPTDARFAVMGIISFIPYFNWLSWVFAWMDTGERRYAVYAIVYLAPYLRSNLSLSPEESWLPIASIVLCIIHVQLEASIRNGDLDGFQFFNEAAKRLSSITRQENGPSEGGIDQKGRTQDHMSLPSDQEHLRDEIRNWQVPQTPSRDSEHENEDGDP